MKYLHVRNLERYQPGYKDRDHIWAKIYHRMLIDPDTKLLSEIAFSRLVKLIVMETYLKKPIPCSEKYLSTLGFDVNTQSIQTTLSELSQMVDLIDVTENGVDAFPREEKRREEYIAHDDAFSSGGKKQETSPRFVAPSPDFEIVWKDYPSKVGKDGALKAFRKSVKTDGDLAEIREALARYLKHLQVNTWKHPKNGDTWFRNWKEWLTFEEVSKNANGTPKPNYWATVKLHPYASQPVRDSSADRACGRPSEDGITNDGIRSEG